MAEVRQLPPGRAGRPWLRERIAGARRAADLLDRKLRLLRAERDRYAVLAEATGRDWIREYRRAERWLLRAGLLAGQEELLMSTVDGRATVAVEWATLLGVRYPVRGTCRLPDPGPDAHRPGSAAVGEAVAAYRSALAAAAAQAAAAAALRVLDQEVARTRRTLRAIAHGRVPRLETALHDLTVRLDEAEREELVRLRWAADSDPAR